MAEIDSFVKIDDFDPAAEFLAREQSVLAEIENDTNRITELNGNINNENSNGISVEECHIERQTTPKESPKKQEKEPEKIRKWREDQLKLLKAKDEEEAKKKQELAEQAAKELQEWYARYKEQLESSKLNNRNAEREWIEERDAETAGQEWEKIAKMCDFNQKAARNSKDTSRMRSILLQLKNQ